MVPSPLRRTVWFIEFNDLLRKHNFSNTNYHSVTFSKFFKFVLSLIMLAVVEPFPFNEQRDHEHFIFCEDSPYMLLKLITQQTAFSKTIIKIIPIYYMKSNFFKKRKKACLSSFSVYLASNLKKTTFLLEAKLHGCINLLLRIAFLG